MKQLLIFLIMVMPFISFSQTVGIGTDSPNASAMLDVSSNNKGMLLPRMNSAGRSAISNPAEGLLVYDTDLNGLFIYNGTSWEGMGSSKERSIYIPANALSYTGTGVSSGQWGLTLTNTANATPGFIIPNPVDWDKNTVFTITLHYSFPTLTSNTIISWRLMAGTTTINSTAANATNGWDSYGSFQSSDATPAAIPAAPGRSNLAKTQTWSATFSESFNTWYVGTGVTTANNFSFAPIWHFRFRRGNAVANGEGYTGELTINGVSINYTAK